MIAAGEAFVELEAIDTTTATEDDVRRTGLGGNDIAAIMGDNPFATAFDVYRAKVDGTTKEETERMRRGKQLESVVLGWYENETIAGSAIVVRNVRRMRHPSHRWWLGQPDGLVYEPERVIANVVEPDGTVAELLDAITGTVCRGPRPGWIVEAKTHGFFAARGYGAEDTDDIPRHYLCQATWYLGLVGLKRCDFAVQMDTHEYRTFRVHRDDALLAGMLQAGHDFWHGNVLARVPPPADGSESRSLWLRERYARSNGRVEIATDAQAQELVAIAKLKAEQSKLEKEIERRNQILQEQVGEASGLVDRSGAPLVTWNINARGNAKYKDAVYALAKRLGATDDEIEEVIEANRGKPGRPWVIKAKPL